jgi:AmmeMemoRadiSam system protein B
MASTRAPAVAGSFYPEDAKELAAEVSRLLELASPGPAPKALIAPHAAYIYSGPIAASIFKRLAGARIERVVLLGPSHFTRLRGLALPQATSFATPLGEVPIDVVEGFASDAAAHAREHSLEVEVPFLQMMLGKFQLVPLAVGDAAREEVAGALDALWGGGETLIVISSDLSHYLPYAEARAADAATAKEILALGRVQPSDACGAAPLNGLLLAARRKEMRAELVDLRNSGDTSGEKRRVVGYGAFAFYPGQA